MLSRLAMDVMASLLPLCPSGLNAAERLPCYLANRIAQWPKQPADCRCHLRSSPDGNCGGPPKWPVTAFPEGGLLTRPLLCDALSSTTYGREEQKCKHTAQTAQIQANILFSGCRRRPAQLLCVPLPSNSE
ncbi:hypothetical protein QBC34DRAFT_403757 [Podospora aff. communis PSN243]|uniref:Uncharacterized protein n=1 Tax=Podospora aff. communis PSN243 TaxID=3040156 RepID=A0AAV9GQ49_9PEZI|nr:hypothetical protein QBC34DRAFT_403757 [Podospora aff. communis PSN243]